ncbi:Protein FATTY ACID EXPORT 1 chloroplastic [Zea mays]|uniref:Protein FATTY ACID EXPORT 1 chloroplastic n=1 Tax=Zea mays TaxID=4577 RepID=A0A1D6KMW3_MAIZE|nr:Protein FATTY ACID EXPORT 1 chloroplastic [Zea mays]
MGLLEYIFSRSTISLVLGIAPGLATLLLGTLSLKFRRSGRSSFLLMLAQASRMNIIILSFVLPTISAFLAWKYSHAYFLTNRLLPWGFYASLRSFSLYRPSPSKAFSPFGQRSDGLSCLKIMQHCNGLFLRLCATCGTKSRK